MRKGYLHIIEIIIITIVMFFVILQFSFLPQQGVRFERARLNLLGNDLLFSLSEKGVNFLDKNQTESQLSSLLAGSNVLYDLEIKNAIKTPFFVGCLCNQTEFDYLSSILASFTLNREKVEFRLTKLKPPANFQSPPFTQADVALPLIYDAIVGFDYNLSGLVGGANYDYTNDLQTFLRAGKGFVQIRDLDASKLNGSTLNTNIYRDFFGISSFPSLVPDNSLLWLTPEPDSPFYNTRKYFHHIPFHDEDFADSVADQWVPSQSTWIFHNTNLPGYGIMYKGNVPFPPAPGVNLLPLSYPENHSVQFDFYFSLGNGPFWTFSYTNQSQFLAVGATPWAGGALVIGNQSLFSLLPASLVAYNSTLATLNQNEFYTLRVTIQKNRVKAIMINSTGKVAEVSFDFSPQGGIPPAREGLLLYSAGDDVYFDNFHFTIPETATFPPFLSPGEGLNVSDNRSERIILQQLGSGIPAVIVNEKIQRASQGGRTVWISGGEDSLHRRALVKALVAWVGGDSYHMVQNNIPNPTIITFFTALDRDMFQPLEIVLRLGHVF